MTVAAARSYAAGPLATVPGWFYREDAELFVLAHEAQARHGVAGDLLEIGAYMGASANLLGHLVRPGERLLVADLFGRDAPAMLNQVEIDQSYGDLSLQGFSRQYLRFHTELPDLHVGPSAGLAQAGLARTFRLAHVDGSHLYDEVLEDMALVESVSVPGAVVVFDDVLRLHTPGVATAVFGAVAQGRLAPLVLTESKLYATWGAPHEGVREALLQAVLAAPDLITQEQVVVGHRCLTARLAPGALPLALRLRRAATPPGLPLVAQRLRQAKARWS